MKSMGIRLFFGLIGSWIMLGGFVSAQNVVNNQGFVSFEQKDGRYRFSCTNQCILVFDTLRSQADFLRIIGNIQGNGTLGYGFLVGQQVIPAEGENIAGDQSLNRTFFFDSFSALSQIPEGAYLALVMQGNLNASDVQIKTARSNFFQYLGSVWSQFWKVEPLTPYSINLRYGTKIGGWNIVLWGYVVGFFGLIYFFFAIKQRKKFLMRMLILFSSIYLVLAIKNLWTMYANFFTAVSSFVFVEKDQRTFFDLGDYIAFTDKVIEALKLKPDTEKKCMMHLDSFAERPFVVHWKAVYFKPCIYVTSLDQANVAVFYKKNPSGSMSGFNKVLEFHGSSLFIRSMPIQ